MNTLTSTMRIQMTALAQPYYFAWLGVVRMMSVWLTLNTASTTGGWPMKRATFDSHIGGVSGTNRCGLFPLGVICSHFVPVCISPSINCRFVFFRIFFAPLGRCRQSFFAMFFVVAGRAFCLCKSHSENITERGI